jgi:catechol 2,3-dioxygenase-like lactoylglutathione lyase family enzyme
VSLENVVPANAGTQRLENVIPAQAGTQYLFFNRPEIQMIRKLHHNAYRCRDSEQTRRFYQDFLGLPLAEAFEINETKSGRQTSVLHSFYQLDDGSYLAFFEVPDMPFEFKNQHDFDLHIALEVEDDVLAGMLAKGHAAGIETRGISEHGMVRSIYFRDPNGYVIELTAKTPEHDRMMDPATNGARTKLDRWQQAKQH